MSIFQKSQRVIKRSAEALNKFNEHRGVKRIKRFTIIIFAFLIIVDVAFVLPNPFPTFSRAVLDSSPKYMFIIWLWGIMTANIFFPRQVKNIVRLKYIGAFLIILVTMLLFAIGDQISNTSARIDCSNFQEQSPPTFTEVICRDDDGAKIDCIATLGECDFTKYDITIYAKFGLLIFGFVFGYFLWPQMEQEPKDLPN